MTEIVDYRSKAMQLLENVEKKAVMGSGITVSELFFLHVAMAGVYALFQIAEQMVYLTAAMNRRR